VDKIAVAILVGKVGDVSIVLLRPNLTGFGHSSIAVQTSFLNSV